MATWATSRRGVGAGGGGSTLARALLLLALPAGAWAAAAEAAEAAEAAAAAAEGAAGGGGALVRELDERSRGAGRGGGAAVVEFYAPWCGLCQGYEPEFAKVARAFRVAAANLTFGRVNIDRHPELAKTFGVRNVPFISVLEPHRWYTIRNGEMRVRPPVRYEGYLGAPPTIEWVNSMLGLDAGYVPYVTELTNATFDAAVRDGARDVLVEYYAPWCGHCQAFAKFYEEVGVAFADDAGVLVAKVDADRYRDVALAHNVTGFPSLHLFPKAYKRKGLAFKGEKKPKNIIAFVQNPQTYLIEAQVLDGLASGELRPLDACDPAEANPWGRCAERLIHGANQLAAERRWAEALELLLQVQHTPTLRKTGIGSSPSMWNLLDNVKFNLEPDVNEKEGGAAATGPGTDGAEAGTWEEAVEQLGQEDIDLGGGPSVDPIENEDFWGFEDKVGAEKEEL